MNGRSRAEALADVWECLTETARSADAHVRGTDSWVPPAEEELVRAAGASGLRRWCPWTSHNHLCFADGFPFWEPDADDDCRELPGSISFDKGGPDGSPVFRVRSGLRMRTSAPVLVLTTPDASAAVEALVGLLEREP
ncbi:hypothetical protein [Streptomyces sp. NPDC047043]|uniref:hypothetical protein n=1 Tax=Streptomyces sp. NPDC047043 TaxID=3154497 RepID=UPI00340490AC